MGSSTGHASGLKLLLESLNLFGNMPIQRKPQLSPPSRQVPDGGLDRFLPAANGCADTEGSAGQIADMKFALFRRVPEDPPHLKVTHEGRVLKVALKRRPTAKR